MRFWVLGAGGVGGVIGGHLARAGYPVTLVARGPHLDAIEARGLRVREPADEWTVRLPVRRRAEPAPDDVVLLAVKSPDTAAALADLPAGIRVVCAQNGVENEGLVAQRHRAYGMIVWLMAVHLEPGVVDHHWAGARGVLDLGPVGCDGGEDVAAALRAAGFLARCRPDIMAWKRAKLVSNAPGAFQAAGLPFVEARMQAAVEEGHAVFAAAGEPVTPLDEMFARCAPVRHAPVAGADRPGGSMWQSIRRGAVLELDALNGYIVRRGRALGVPTPINAELVDAVHAAAR